MQRIKLLKLLNTTYFLKLNIHIGNDPKYTNLYINKFIYGNATNFVIFNIQRLFLELKKIYLEFRMTRVNRLALVGGFLSTLTLGSYASAANSQVAAQNNLLNSSALMNGTIYIINKFYYFSLVTFKYH